MSNKEVSQIEEKLVKAKQEEVATSIRQALNTLKTVIKTTTKDQNKEDIEEYKNWLKGLIYYEYGITSSVDVTAKSLPVLVKNYCHNAAINEFLAEFDRMKSMIDSMEA